MVISYGEILMDTFERDGKKTAFIGGAPFNVSYVIHKLNGDSLFVGNIGEDEYGKDILSFFHTHSLDSRGIFIHQDKSTLYSKVVLKDNDRFFTFERENSAENDFPLSSLSLVQEAKIVHVGTFLLSTKEGFSFALKLIEETKKQDKILSFDVNYREDIFDDKKECLSRYKAIIQEADILKFSKDELLFFTGTKTLEEGLNQIRGRKGITLITDASKGSYALLEGNVFYQESPKVKAVDPTGAGDAFFGAFLEEADRLSLDKLKKNISSVLLFSNVSGGFATEKVGALSSIPTREQIKERIQKLA